MDYKSSEKKWVMLTAAVLKMEAMLFRISAATVGCVSISQMINARKRNPTILRKFTDNHRSDSEPRP
jgi:hypothetical protein